ncbi:pyridoxal-phosphate dependent enzyme [Streptomyces sp. 3MP-14]|uniref:Pyridoxal-phosphate dependent enzyme n=1 Tax=Streptomyces mimosae TaxID=2586635 RepID=A0A5N6AJ14_9ACTN|nr:MULTISPECIES: pyridoxal-phosphate dependent enzyme [Streptomyces]KAB8168837.1 pyridoxal-phosphate dependent enzyme [Streptomyces mimosae]KAB8177883.1 pyridoxal-phosphate dependent enzyme [Streptomyces sp. 3MP-14]
MENTSQRPEAAVERAEFTDLRLSQVLRARTVIPACFLDTPQYEDDLLNAALGRRVTVKLETANPIRSFKGRGVGFALGEVPAGETVVCASSGNFGQAVAYIGRSRGLKVVVYAPAPVNPVKRARMTAFGAQVIEVDEGTGDAGAAASAAAEERGAHLIVDGVPPEIAEGAATMAEELTRAGTFDTLVAPIGDGSLISGLALWMRGHAPHTRIVGVNPAEAPAMLRSWQAGEPVTARPTSGFAEGIAIPRPHPESVERVRALVDDIVLVDERELRDAMGLVARQLSVLAEPAGAAGIAAIAAGRVAGERVATVVTGANPNPLT